MLVAKRFLTVAGVSFLATLLSSVTSFATTYTVDAKAQPSSTTYTSLSALLAAVSFKGGDIVKVKPTDVYRDRIKFLAQHSGDVGNPVIIECDAPGRAVWDGSTTNVDDYGYLWTFFEAAHDIEVRRIEVRNVQPGPDQNNRAVFIRGRNITVKDSYIHHNPNGFFSTTDAYNTRIENCEVAFNGAGTGYSHNFYLQGQGSHVLYCYIHDANAGINYKDRSLPDASGLATEFCYNWVENASGGGYDLDFSVSGLAAGRTQDALLVGNVIFKGGNSNKAWVLVFGNDGRTGNLRMCNNTIIGSSADNSLVWLGSGAKLTFTNNIYFRGERLMTTTSGGVLTGSNNWLMTNTQPDALQNTVFGQYPGFLSYDAEDFRLATTAPAATAGLGNLPTADMPKFEYVKDTFSQARKDSGKCLGAFALDASLPTPVTTGNLAMGRPATASSTMNLLGMNSASKLVDNSTATFWHSELDQLRLEWVQVDLQAASRLTKVELVFRTDADQNITRRNFSVYASNDPDFRSGVVRLATRAASAVAYGTTWSAAISDTRTYRYVRFTKHALEYDSAGATYWNLSEMRVWGSQK